MATLKQAIKRIPILGPVASWLYWKLPANRRILASYPGSEAFWERHYASGGNSGDGSYGVFSQYKAEFLNKFVTSRQVRSVIEFGCGDGNQLRLAEYPKYCGLDVSATAISRCKELYKFDESKSFRLLSEYTGEKAELALSLDVIFHLTENSAYDRYLRMLFGASRRYVIIYSSDFSDRRFDTLHVRHRKFTAWIRKHAPNWKLIEHVPNPYPYRGDYRTGTFSEFFCFEKA